MLRSLVFIALSGMAATGYAQGLDYSFVEVEYTRAESTQKYNREPHGLGRGIRISVDLADSGAYVLAGYRSMSYGALKNMDFAYGGTPYLRRPEPRYAEAGIGYHHAVHPRVDLTAEGALLRGESERRFGSDNYGVVDAEETQRGVRLALGARAAFNEHVEMHVSVNRIGFNVDSRWTTSDPPLNRGWVDVGDFYRTTYRAGIAAKLHPRIAAVAAVEYFPEQAAGTSNRTPPGMFYTPNVMMSAGLRYVF